MPSILRGDLQLLGSLNDYADIVHFYVSAAGNDTTGDGAQGTPYRQIQAALDRIPDTAVGSVVIHLVGAGPFLPFNARNYFSTLLSVYIVGDTSTATYTLTAGTASSAPSNPSGGSKCAVLEYSQAHPAISDGSHWANLKFSADLPYGQLPDGANSTSPITRLVTTFDGVSFADADIHPFTSVIDDDSRFQVAITAEESIPGFSQVVWVIGVVIGAGGRPALNIGPKLNGCKTPHGISDLSRFPYIEVWNNGSLDATGEGGNIAGIYTGTGSVAFRGRSATLTGVYRCRDGTGTVMYLGSPAGGSPGPTTAVELDYADFEPAGGGNCIEAIASQIRCSNNSGVSVTGISRFVRTRFFCYVDFINRVYGGCAGVPVVLREHSSLRGASALPVGGLNNTSVPGNDVLIGGDTTARAFSLVPKTDIATGDSCQFCRSSA